MGVRYVGYHRTPHAFIILYKMMNMFGGAGVFRVFEKHQLREFIYGEFS